MAEGTIMFHANVKQDASANVRVKHAHINLFMAVLLPKHWKQFLSWLLQALCAVYQYEWRKCYIHHNRYNAESCDREQKNPGNNDEYWFKFPPKPSSLYHMWSSIDLGGLGEDSPTCTDQGRVKEGITWKKEVSHDAWFSLCWRNVWF